MQSCQTLHPDIADGVVMTLCSAILLRNVALWINRMIMCLGNGPEREEEV